MINPMKLMQLKGMISRFNANHPRIQGFFNAAMNGMEEGCVVEMTVISPEGKKLCANIRVNAEDMELFREIKNMDISNV